MKKLFLALISVMALTACQNTNVEQAPQGNSASSSSIVDAAVMKEYRNDKYGFQLSVPSDWSTRDTNFQPPDDLIQFQLENFMSPVTKEALEMEEKQLALYPDEGFEPASPDLTVSVLPDFIRTQGLNNVFAFYSDKEPRYTSLSDFFANRGSQIEKVKERQISGSKAYEASSYDDFVLLVEHRGNLLTFKIPYHYDMTEEWLVPDSRDDRILQSITLY